MSDDPHRSELPPALSAAATAEWSRHVERVLSGVAHGLNNRAAALAALVELTSEPAEQPAVLREILNTEQQRVRDLVHAVRTIGESRGTAEALLPADVVSDVVIVLEQHPDLRDGTVQIDATQGSPIRAPRWTLARALLALAAGLTGGTRAKPRRLVLTTEGDWLIVTADDGAVRTSTLATELARQMGGEPLDGRYGVRLPTLAALRRREGR
jgi:hypothetical protein